MAEAKAPALHLLNVLNDRTEVIPLGFAVILAVGDIQVNRLTFVQQPTEGAVCAGGLALFGCIGIGVDRLFAEPGGLVGCFKNEIAE